MQDLAALLQLEEWFGYAVNCCDRSGGVGGQIDRDWLVCCLKESQVAEHF